MEPKSPRASPRSGSAAEASASALLVAAASVLVWHRALGYAERGMEAYAKVQDREFELQKQRGYAAVKHQGFVGTGYFDEIARCVSAGENSTAALEGSTEERQF